MQEIRTLKEARPVLVQWLAYHYKRELSFNLSRTAVEVQKRASRIAMPDDILGES